MADSNDIKQLLDSFTKVHNTVKYNDETYDFYYEFYVTTSGNKDRIAAALEKHPQPKELDYICASCKPRTEMFHSWKASYVPIVLFGQKIFSHSYVLLSPEFNNDTETLLAKLQEQVDNGNAKRECPTCGARTYITSSECPECGEVYEIIDPNKEYKVGLPQALFLNFNRCETCEDANAMPEKHIKKEVLSAKNNLKNWFELKVKDLQPVEIERRLVYDPQAQK